MITLCKNLRLRVELDAEARQVRVALTDPMTMAEAELRYTIGSTTPESEGYHIREAIVIALCRLVGQAMKAGLIEMPTRMPTKDTVVMAAKLTPETISTFTPKPGVNPVLKPEPAFDFFADVPNRADLEKAVEKYCVGYTKTVCLEALKVAAARDEFTAEDVRPFCEPLPGEENKFSSAMLEAKRLSIIKVLRYENAAREKAKGRIIPVYTRGFK